MDMLLFLAIALTIYISMMTVIVMFKFNTVFSPDGRIRDFGTDTDGSRSVLSLHVLAPLCSIMSTAIGASCVLL